MRSISINLIGTIWFLMRLRPSKTRNLKDGIFYFNLRLETDSYFLGRLYRIQWLSFGLCFTSSCLSSLILMSISKNGFQKTLKHSHKTKEIKWLTRSIFKDFIKFLSHLCFDELKQMLSQNLDLRKKLTFIAKWHTDKGHFISDSKTKFISKIYLTFKTLQRWILWWTSSCNSEKFAIIQNCFKFSKLRVLSSWSLIYTPQTNFKQWATN